MKRNFVTVALSKYFYHNLTLKIIDKFYQHQFSNTLAPNQLSVVPYDP
jgi:hypothetical protein